MAKSEQVKIQSKGQSLGEFEYVYPESLEEGLTMDGEESVFKLYTMQRKIRFMDSKRRELTGGGLPKALTEKLRGLSKDKLAEIASLLDLEL
jgi:hypothetical protein